MLVLGGAPSTLAGNGVRPASDSAPAATVASQTTPDRAARQQADTPTVLRQWHGESFDAMRIRSAIVYDFAAWRRILNIMNLRPVPKVDFHDALAVILTTDGPEPYWGYFIAFGKPHRDHGVLIVPYCVEAPRSGRRFAAIVFPWAAILIHARDRKVALRNTCPD